MKVNVIKSKEETLSLDEALNVRGGLSQASDGSEVECGCDCWIGNSNTGTTNPTKPTNPTVNND